jgi:uncharacterized SAM-binding protein YcdF (DUF218 family)
MHIFFILCSLFRVPRSLAVQQISHLIKKYWILAIAGFLIPLVLIIPLRLTVARIEAPLPQAFFILGGDPARESFTAELARWYPSLEIWVSSPPEPDKTRKVFQAAGIVDARLHIDLRAVDTVTNFTTLIPDFNKHRIQNLFLITSDFHMSRAKAIATLILGSHGIAFTPLSVPSNRPKESLFHILRDIARSVIWIFTGRTGASLQKSLASSFICI